jgi:hypothetical protein
MTPYDEDIKKALRTIRARLRSGGIVLISLRDYLDMTDQPMIRMMFLAAAILI